MTKLQFYLFDISYKIVDEKPVVYLYGKTYDGRQVCVFDRTFKPYFYAVPKQGVQITDKIKQIEIDYSNEKFFVTSVESETKNVLGKKTQMLKVYVNLPKGVPLIKDILKDWEGINAVYEYDIRFERRYLIDRGIIPLSLITIEVEPAASKSRVPVFEAMGVPEMSDETAKNPRMLAVDIETYNPSEKRSNPEKDPIVMIGFYSENFEKVITWREFATKEGFIEFVKSEAELLERFKEVVESFKPDIITGYFSDGFDFPYLKTRAHKYKINLDIGLDFSELQVKGRYAAESEIRGIVHLDIFQFIRRVVSRSLKTDVLTLDAVAGELIGEQKKHVDMDKLAYIWDSGGHELENFCSYNLRDAQITYQLAIKLMPNIIELVKIVGLPIYDLTRMSFSQLVEWYIIKQAKQFNEIILNRPHFSQTEERLKRTYKAAFVYEPKPGLYNNIALFDFRSLYPTIIVSYNVSPDTMNCKCCEEKQKAPLEKNIWFCTRKKGFLPAILEDLVTRRMRVKEIIKQAGKDALLIARSEALKVLSNAFSGYLGFHAARWYSIECIESVTAWGRYHINDVISKAKAKGFEVLYGDTDSVFLLMGDKSKDTAEAFLNEVNAQLPNLMELELQGFYPTGLFVSAKLGSYGAKKKYALLGENGELIIKGFETIRRNWSPIAKETQRTVIEIILKTGDCERALEYVRGVIRGLKENKVSIAAVTINTQLQKSIGEYETIAPHVAAAKLMQEKGIDVGPGTLVRFVVCKGGGKIREKVKLPEDAQQSDYDSEYYIDNQIVPSIERLFSILGRTKEDLVGQKQSTLGSFVK